MHDFVLFVRPSRPFLLNITGEPRFPVSPPGVHNVDANFGHPALGRSSLTEADRAATWALFSLRAARAPAGPSPLTSVRTLGGRLRSRFKRTNAGPDACAAGREHRSRSGAHDGLNPSALATADHDHCAELKVPPLAGLGSWFESDDRRPLGSATGGPESTQGLNRSRGRRGEGRDTVSRSWGSQTPCETGVFAMLDRPISPLRQRMIDDMTARRFKEKVRRGGQRGRSSFACASMSVLRRPDDHRRNVRRRAPCAFTSANPDQDRHLMIIAALPASNRLSPSPHPRAGAGGRRPLQVVSPPPTAAPAPGPHILATELARHRRFRRQDCAPPAPAATHASRPRS